MMPIESIKQIRTWPWHHFLKKLKCVPARYSVKLNFWFQFAGPGKRFKIWVRDWWEPKLWRNSNSGKEKYRIVIGKIILAQFIYMLAIYYIGKIQNIPVISLSQYIDKCFHEWLSFSISLIEFEIEFWINQVHFMWLDLCSLYANLI